MKRSLAFLAAGAAWILFCGLIGLELPPSLNPFPQAFTSSPPLVFERPPHETSLSPFFSSLDERWRNDRLLAIAA